MNWIESIDESIRYIEKNITEDLTVESISKEVCISPFYFQKGFSMLCGFSISEYIRYRRLALAGSELVSTDNKVIDIALKYGYESPDSFTKSFTRFHGVTPSDVKKGETVIRSFAPLRIKVTLEGGYFMDYKIVEKEEFSVVGLEKEFAYDNAMEEVPKMWDNFFKMSESTSICSTYGINNDEDMKGNQFKYLIGDNYDTAKDIPESFVIKTIPKFTWAVFECKGPMPSALQDMNKRIFSEWLPSCKDYEIAAGYCVEMYSDPADFSKGTGDENYYSEMWIPVKMK